VEVPGLAGPSPRQRRTFKPTHPLYWAIGGLLLRRGLSRRSSGGLLAAVAGVAILAVKVAETLSWVAGVPSVRLRGEPQH